MALSGVDMLQHHHERPEPADTTGCSPGSRQQMQEQGARPRPLAEAWISDALIEEAIAVWSRLYRRRVTREEAVDMLMNVKRLGLALVHAARELDRP
jgi:hypothetical protein